MIINNNIRAENAYRHLSETQERQAASLEKLSSGVKINRAGDDAAGLAISEKMRSQIKGLEMAVRNAQDGISLIQTAEGALNETHAILQRMRELAVQSSNDTNTDADRRVIQQEMDQLRREIDRIADTTEFNTKQLLTGKYGYDPKNNSSNEGLKFQIGSNEGQTVVVTFDKMDAYALGIAGKEVKATTDRRGNDTKKEVISSDKAVSVITSSDAEKAISVLNKAVEKVSEQRAKYGAMQNRLEHTINNLRVASENLQAAESRIRDVDVAKEMVSFSKEKILSQSGTAMLAQANSQPKEVLKLIKE
ncbi:flagellin [Hypnocyclicus thermotrophus]|uniref:Flagellin n=1 Tax=Hypnocyclicus thermotrophus TaxID=1627895 RepID=A0AA46DYG4_9FUSO|nr:flagellin [Hypnocyclicus thermotrophus]TDT69235.1 flagellin [Hypnocyclicus thermotrophus]